MPRVIALAALTTVVELALLCGVAHVLLRYPMEARGIVPWRLADTLLASPLFFIGSLWALGALNRGLALAAVRWARGEAAGGALLWGTAAMVMAGATMAWFGTRGMGKLY